MADGTRFEGEHHDIYRPGDGRTIHRCKRCVKQHWYRTGHPATDNGFVPISARVPHDRDCPDYGKY